MRGNSAQEHAKARSPLKVLTWNLFHGRALPAAGRSLLGEFSARLSSWDWDVALLQEVPPWWPARLARDSGAEEHTTLTSRNSLLPVRRAIARRAPDLLKSNGGGANAILARTGISASRSTRLRLWPERRVAQFVLLSDGLNVVNFHASTHPSRARAELLALWESGLSWAGSAPLILGGDLNLRSRQLPELPAARVASGEVDHLYARGPWRASHFRPLERHWTSSRGDQLLLSDHAPLLAELDGSDGPTGGQFR